MFVATTRLRASQSLRVLRALPEKMPCVTRATIEEAPFSRSVLAALARVPHVSGGWLGLVFGEVELGWVSGCVPAMSSTRMAHLSLTLPTRVICGVTMLGCLFEDEILV